jgi:hypothetical protein
LKNRQGVALPKTEKSRFREGFGFRSGSPPCFLKGEPSPRYAVVAWSDEAAAVSVSSGAAVSSRLFLWTLRTGKLKTDNPNRIDKYTDFDQHTGVFGMNSIQ